MSARQHNRLASESADNREARLQQMHDRQCDRLASESAEEREARLQRMRALLHVRSTFHNIALHY